MVPVDSVGVPRDPTYSGTPREIINIHLRDCHPLWSAVPEQFCLSIIFLLPCERPYNPAEKISAVWAVSRSLAATEEIDFSFSSTGYLDVSVHRVGRLCLCIQHSLIREPRDQHSFDSSPKIFAVFHALHRRLTPRHPPCALNCLTT